MADLFDLTGKVAVLVGGADRTGFAGPDMALGLAERGADIVIAAAQLEPFEEVVDKIRTMGRRVLAIEVDIMQNEQAGVDIIKRSREAFGHIDIMVNYDGRRKFREVNAAYPDEWQESHWYWPK